MSQTTAANRYAKALFQLAQENNVLTEVTADLREAKKVFEESELFGLLDSPKIVADKKRELIDSIFASAQPFVGNAFKVLLDKGRIHESVSVVDAFIRYANDAQGVADAVVYSTTPLTEELSQRISTAFAKNVGKETLNITNVIDPSLLGGIKVQIGNHIYDNTVVTKLASLKRKLIG